MNAVIYARFSIHSQREQSIEGQPQDLLQIRRRQLLHRHRRVHRPSTERH